MTVSRTKQWDVFISHASPDKAAFVTPLAEELLARGVKVWLDQWAIKLGDSISEAISEGLTKSRFGIVVLSKEFFKRAYAMKELGALLANESGGRVRIIPLWHEIDVSEVMEYAPLLADKKAARSDEGVESIAERIVRLLALDGDDNSSVTPEALRELTKRLFPRLPVDEFWQFMLLADLDGEMYRSVGDIELAYQRARPAVEAYSREYPDAFTSGTDYLTKALGFVDLCFRSRHGWSRMTRQAFDKYAGLVTWEARATPHRDGGAVEKPAGSAGTSSGVAAAGGLGRVDLHFSAAYEELERIASRLLLNERPDTPLSPGDLISETYLKLAGSDRLIPGERENFLAVAVGMMRRLLTRRAKESGPHEVQQKIFIEGFTGNRVERTTVDLIHLDEALERLMSSDERLARVIELYFFGGLTIGEVAAILNVTLAAAARDIKMAKAWLARELRN